MNAAPHKGGGSSRAGFMPRPDGPGPSPPAPLIPGSSSGRRGERLPAATLIVCVTCKSEQGALGAGLFAALGERLAAEPDIALKAVECLSVCKRPCTVALAAAGKWTYVVGDLARDEHIEDIVTSARLYAASPDGIVPWRERPLSFRKGVVARTPPLMLPEASLS
jgi:predicted metal-binding protein